MVWMEYPELDKVTVKASTRHCKEGVRLIGDSG
jgi:hypothetical protein